MKAFETHLKQHLIKRDLMDDDFEQLYVDDIVLPVLTPISIAMTQKRKMVVRFSPVYHVWNTDGYLEFDDQVKAVEFYNMDMEVTNG